MKILRFLFISILVIGASLASATQYSSPNGKLCVNQDSNHLTVFYQGKMVLDASVTIDSPLQWVRKVTDDYQMLTGKRLHCHNEANEYRSGKMLLRVYNNGIALRNTEVTYRIPEGMHRWMQQWCDSYEGFFPLDTTYKIAPIPSYSGISKSKEGWNNHWGYPALLEPTDGIFVLLSEANIEQGQSASSLFNEGEWYRVIPAETIKGKTCDHTPWQLAIIGSLSDVVESTLVTDVSNPCKIKDTSWIKPGAVSWIYWAYNHGSNDYNIIQKYVDMARDLQLPYVLIDAEWDEMKDGKTIEDAVNYAKAQGVKPLIWYNSSVGWVDGAPTPKFRLNKADDREREFAWLEKIGVAGVKIDFFSGDTQRNMDYCIDLLESAARHHLLVNFHGATIPRGWQRTYPNLMTTEGVYGAEWYNNVATFTDKAACHNATLPFTRNVIGPMDYTPCTFSDSQHPHITTKAHELALTVLFESALQHLADRPESYMVQPQEVKDFFTNLPTVWDETHLLSGYPGESVVMARRNGKTWYIAGINGTNQEKELTIDKKAIGKFSKATLFEDTSKGDWNIHQIKKLPTSIICQPRGGFIIVIN